MIIIQQKPPSYLYSETLELGMKVSLLLILLLKMKEVVSYKTHAHANY